MMLLLDTSTPLCCLTLIDGEQRHEVEWEAGRELARGLLGFIEAELREQDKVFADITALGAYKGPGSFTGLRIGLTVLNALADSLGIPIVGETGDGWQQKAIRRLEAGESEQIILPLYGGEAHITLPRK